MVPDSVTHGVRDFHFRARLIREVGPGVSLPASNICSYTINGVSEPLIPLARAVAATVQRLQLDDVEVLVDREGGTVIAEGAGMANWGQRQRLEHALDQARLTYETRMPRARIVVYPS